MAQIIISSLPPLPNGTGSGTPKGTDLTPATDTTDTTEAATGTTKKYTRSAELNFYLAAQSLTTYAAVLGATTGALTVVYANGVLGVGATLTNAGAQAAFTVDGVTFAVGNRVLVKNQASTFQNGIYTVTTLGTGATNWVLTRATDYDQAADVVQYGVVLSNQGTVNAGKLWQETGAGPWTMGTTAIVFAAFTTQSLALPVSLAQGGTQAALVADNGGVFFSNATTAQILASTSTANQMLMSGASQVGGWSTATWPVATTINQILYSSAANTVAGLASANNGLLVTSATGVPSILAGPGTTGNILQSNAAAPPSFSTATYPSVATSTGTILRANGTNWVASTATFADTYAVSTILYASASNVVTGLAAANRAVLTSGATGIPVMTALAADGQVIIGSTAGVPAAATLTPGTGIAIANGSNTITISATGGGFGVATIAGTSQAAAVNTMYIALNAGQTTLTLPAVYSVGDSVILVGSTANTGGWIVTAAAGDTVRVNNSTTSAGGTVTSSAVAGQTIEIVCDVANTSWVMMDTSSVILTTA